MYRSRANNILEYFTPNNLPTTANQRHDHFFLETRYTYYTASTYTADSLNKVIMSRTARKMYSWMHTPSQDHGIYHLKCVHGKNHLEEKYTAIIIIM